MAFQVQIFSTTLVQVVGTNFEGRSKKAIDFRKQIMEQDKVAVLKNEKDVREKAIGTAMVDYFKCMGEQIKELRDKGS